MDKLVLVTFTVLLVVLIGCASLQVTQQPVTPLAGSLPNERSTTPAPEIARDEQQPGAHTTQNALNGESAETSYPSNRMTSTVEARRGCGLILPIVADENRIGSHQIADDFDERLIPESALPALKQIVSSPQNVAVVAFEIGNEAQGIYHNGESLMPLASVVKLVNLVAFAEALEDGQLDATAWVPLDELAKFYLPGTDLGAHQRAISELQIRGLIGRNPPSIPLEEIPWMMIRHSSNAASDYIHMTLGQEAIERTALQIGLKSQTAPCPWIGQFLTIRNHQMDAGESYTAVQKFVENPSLYGREVMELTTAFIEDPDFRQEELSQRWRGELRAQRLFSKNLNAQGTAAEYANLLATIMNNNIGSPYVNIIVRRALEWPSQFVDNQENFFYIGYKDGSLPGILTTAYYAQRRADGSRIVVVLFFKELSMPMYREWRRSLPHDELARWLLVDSDAISILRGVISSE